MVPDSINGQNLIQQLAASFMPVAVNNCLRALIDRGALLGVKLQNSSEVASQLKLNENATGRFLNAATSLGLLNLDSNHNYSLMLNPPAFNTKGADVLFWILRNEINGPLADNLAFDVKSLFAAKTDGGEMLREAVHLGILKEEKGVVTFTPELSTYLNPASDLYMGLWIKNYDQIASKIFNENFLLEALRTGETQWQAAFGANVRNPFDLVNVNAGLFCDLMEGMHQANATEGRYFARCVDFSNVETVLDIGGASGALALTLAKEHSSIKEIDIYDLDTAVPLYKKMYERYSSGTHYPIKYIEGNFFRGLQSSTLSGIDSAKKYDLLSLGWILHDWQDREALVILRKIRAHIKQDGRLVIAEAILPDNRLGPVSLLDLTMLLQTGGRERTLGEYLSLLDQSGFKLIEVIETGGRRQLIVATPVAD